jgi:hypothetical protein
MLLIQTEVLMTGKQKVPAVHCRRYLISTFTVLITRQRIVKNLFYSYDPRTNLMKELDMSKVKTNFFPLPKHYTMKLYRGKEGKTPFILDLGAERS